MNDEHTQIRVFGQRSISSSFLSGSSNRFKRSNDKAQMKSSKSSHCSLSDFLDRKLPETSVAQSTVKGKSTPFFSLRTPKHSSDSVDGKIGTFIGSDSETNKAIAKVIFEQFKRSDIDRGDRVVSESAGAEDITNADDIQESRKRKKPIEGQSKTRKNVIVLGGDAKPEHKGKEAIRIRNKRPKPLYNHYANGCGWWDGDMEGLDMDGDMVRYGKGLVPPH